MSIAQYEPRNEVALSAAQDLAVHRLTEWAQSAQAAHQIATTLVQTSFVPDSFRNKPGEATAAILAGLEVGLQPMAALRSFDVIQGQAAPRAITLRAIIQSRGHEIEVVESTATRCRMRGRRKGATDWQTVTWTIERARDLGVTNKANWKNQPQAMLVARATSELSRLVASDAILGIAYSSEEIADGGTTDQHAAEVTTTPQQPAATRRMVRRTTVDGHDTAPAEPEPPAEASADGDSPTMFDYRSGWARAEFFPALRAAEEADPDFDAKAFMSEVVGRTVASSKELLAAEAQLVFDNLPRETVQGELVEDGES